MYNWLVLGKCPTNYIHQYDLVNSLKNTNTYFMDNY